MAHIVGIDLGTTNSLVAHLDAGVPRLVPNRAGQSSTPSIVGLDPKDRLHVGATAKNQLVALPDRTVAEVKRLMGTSERVLLGPRTYTATEVSGIILRALKEDAERFLGDTVDEAVVTVPAYFTDAQRKATKDAGELAGLRVERILNEPTAAALAYGLDNLDKEQLVLVYDLGGGTFDVSVLEMFDGVLEVKASAGNNRLGGGDFDRAIVAWLVAAFERAHGVDVRADLRAMARLRAAAEQAKIELTLLESTTITLPFLAARAGEPLSFEVELSRAEMERLLLELVRQTLPPMESALADARVDRKQIAEVVLVGGASRMPMVERLVAEFFGKPARRGVNPDEAVALGAAVQAGLKTGAIASDAGIMITDVCPFTLGVEVRSSAGSQHVEGLFSPIIPRNSTVPISRTEVYATTTDRQAKVDIRVFQGESRLVKNNVFLDAYAVDGVPPGPAGTEKVAVTFTYDVNGILAVTTKVVSTGKEATLRVDKSPQRMSDKAREEARERIEREWTGAAPGPAAPGPARSVATVSPSAASPAPPAAASSSEPGLGALVAAARARASSVPEDAAMRLRALATEAETALAQGDRAAIARLDVALTELLFDLS